MHESRRIAMRLAALVSIPLFGCQALNRWTVERWETDYVNAERRARAADRTMLILFRDGRKPIDKPLEAIRKSKKVKPLLRPFEWCELYRTAEADRRYADQFHVQRAPALILAHPDDTYQAWTGPWNEADVIRFLTESKPPGSPADRNPYLARKIEYRWFETWRGAQDEARRRGRPTLVAVHRAMTPDWHKLSRLLAQPEVFSRCNDMVHCRLTCLNPLAASYDAPFGNVKVPALAVIASDGTLEAVLEMPGSSAAIVRFLNDRMQASPSGRASATEDTSP
jgi:hypothetical protein